jgi:hypothetical protein
MTSSEDRPVRPGSPSLPDWLFRNRQTGRITVAQFPNAALWIYILTVVLGWFLHTGTTARTVDDGIGVAALAWWAVDELCRGVNPWRRLLGLGGCVVVCARLVSLVR